MIKPFPDKKYKTIYADPPWPYGNNDLGATKKNRPNSYNKITAKASSALRYGNMSIEDIFKLKPPSGNDAHLYLWVTNGFLVEGHKVAESWGFKPKTLITWAKVKQNSMEPSMKMGYYFRGATEHMLFCVKGSQRLIGPPCPTWFPAERLPHSRKPLRAYEIIEEQSLKPRLELFARPLTPMFPARPGWDVWGDEVDDACTLNPVLEMSVGKKMGSENIDITGN